MAHVTKYANLTCCSVPMPLRAVVHCPRCSTARMHCPRRPTHSCPPATSHCPAAMLASCSTPTTTARHLHTMPPPESTRQGSRARPHSARPSFNESVPIKPRSHHTAHLLEDTGGVHDEPSGAGTRSKQNGRRGVDELPHVSSRRRILERG